MGGRGRDRVRLPAPRGVHLRARRTATSTSCARRSTPRAPPGSTPSWSTAVDLPWQVAGAVRLDDQAEFHPRRFLLAVAAELHGGGSHVFERTRVTGVARRRLGAACETDTGGEVSAGAVVLATHYPTLDRGLFFARLAAERSYALGVRARGPRAAGHVPLDRVAVALGARRRPYDGGELLIVGGESHKTGTGGDTTERYRALEEWAREHFDVETVEYRWSAQDAMPADGIPYVGKLSPVARNCGRRPASRSGA